MRVLISAYACEPDRGGEPGVGWNWSFHNARLGNDVVCLTLALWRPSIESYLQDNPIPDLRFEYVEVPDWIEKFFDRGVAGVGFGRYIHYIAWQYAALRRARTLSEADPFDVVHHVSFTSLQMGTSLSKLGVPLIFGPVGGGQFTLPQFRRYFSETWKNELFRRVMSFVMMRLNPHARRAVKRSAMVLATNHETAELANRHGAKRVEIFVDTGLPESFLPASRPPHERASVFRLLWVGRMMERKGLRLVLEALTHLPSDFAWQMTVLGDGRLGAKLPKWLDELDLADHVHWPGSVPWSEVAEALRSHDAFVFCTLRDSFGSQFMEAMAYGLPIVCLDLSGARSIIPDAAGIRINPDGPGDLPQRIASAIVELATDGDRYETASQAGFDFASRQTWQRLVSEMQTYYSEIMTRTRDP